eukprot:13897138-Alexandrium_andersonii.AAC.1
MSASLVGSEMCIRDRPAEASGEPPGLGGTPAGAGSAPVGQDSRALIRCCLLYTSDAADDM